MKRWTPLVTGVVGAAVGASITWLLVERPWCTQSPAGLPLSLRMCTILLADPMEPERDVPSVFVDGLADFHQLDDADMGGTIARVQAGGPEALAWLRTQVRAAPTPAERLRAIRLLGMLEDAGAFDALVEALQTDPDEEVREEAAEALGDLRVEAGARALLQALQDDPSTEVRVEAAISLGRLRSVEAVPALGQVLCESGEQRLRRTAALALARIRRPEAGPFLDVGRGDANPEVRLASLGGLAALGDVGAVEELVREYGRVQAEFGERAGDYQEQILWHLAEAVNPAAAPLFREVLAADPDSGHLRMAIPAVQALGDAESAPLLEWIAAKHPDEGVRRAAEQARDTVRRQGPR